MYVCMYVCMYMYAYPPETPREFSSYLYHVCQVHYSILSKRRVSKDVGKSIGTVAFTHPAPLSPQVIIELPRYYGRTHGCALGTVCRI
jgi:hypothetical protein